MTNEQLIAKLTEYAEWCDENEWEIPIDMGDLLREAAQKVRDMDERALLILLNSFHILLNKTYL